jgi:phosphoadenosine phosphosulfate reductase
MPSDTVTPSDTGLHIPENIEALHPADILRWTFDRFGVEHTVVTASFEDAVLAHLAWSVNPAARIVVLDTQYLFAETEWLIDEMRRRFDMPIEVVRPVADVRPDNKWQTDVEGCCAVRKVEPLNRALAGAGAWVTGVRRSDGPTRADAPIASHDLLRNLAKVNPLAAWTDAEVALYTELHELPVHPLADRGYPSIGCWPCTRPVAPGEDKRAGRWSGHAKTECGLHV